MKSTLHKTSENERKRSEAVISKCPVKRNFQLAGQFFHFFGQGLIFHSPFQFHRLIVIIFQRSNIFIEVSLPVSRSAACVVNVSLFIKPDTVQCLEANSC